jgi:DNA-binding transcriptional LysR family regulator
MDSACLAAAGDVDRGTACSECTGFNWPEASPLVINDYPRALADHQCVVLARDSARTNWTLEGPSGPIGVTVSGRFRANNARAVMQAAAAGLGIALLSYPLCVAEIEAGRLVRVLAEYRQETASVYAAFPNRRQIARAVSVFVDFVSEKLRLDGASWRQQ